MHDIADPGKLYSDLMNLIVSLAQAGLIHSDFNEFNILVTDDDRPILIDFPQMVSTSHVNAEWYFDRDVECIRTFFRRRFGYESRLYPRFSVDVTRQTSLDVEVAASGFFAKRQQDEFEELYAAARRDAPADEDEDEDEDEDDEDAGSDASDEDGTGADAADEADVTADGATNEDGPGDAEALGDAALASTAPLTRANLRRAHAAAIAAAVPLVVPGTPTPTTTATLPTTPPARTQMPTRTKVRWPPTTTRRGGRSASLAAPHRPPYGQPKTPPTPARRRAPCARRASRPRKSASA